MKSAKSRFSSVLFAAVAMSAQICAAVEFHFSSTPDAVSDYSVSGSSLTATLDADVFPNKVGYDNAAVSALADFSAATGAGTFFDVGVNNNNSVQVVYNGDGTFLLTYNGKAAGATYTVTTAEIGVAGPHVWTLRYNRTGGSAFYRDGELVASSGGIKWNDHGAIGPVKVLVPRSDSETLAGATLHAAYLDVEADGWDVAGDIDALYALFGNEYLSDTSYSAETKATLFAQYAADGEIVPVMAETCVLRISEIMPKPTDDRNPGEREGMDVNGLESGWVEVENVSDSEWADLADYRFVRFNRGKKTDSKGSANFPMRLVPPRSRAVFYTSERYPNSDEEAESAFDTGTFDAKPAIYPELNNVLVWGKKINPKKFPFVRLYYAPGGDSDAGTAVDTVEIHSDVPEGYSIIVGETVAGEATKRWLCPTPTRARANTPTDALVKIGPVAGPLYELRSLKKHDSTSEFARPAPPATPGEDYSITFSFNPVMSPTEPGAFRDEDAIASIELVYRTDLDDSTLATAQVDTSKGKFDKNDWGWTYTATIPHSAFDSIGPGHLIQWKFIATDASGNTWTAPSFNNPDDGYEWYGTIVEPSDLDSATLPTWHMFAAGDHLSQMDEDKDAQDRSLVPNYARVAIYDSTTSNYYDYVRIDRRGNTSAKFTKKSHGLRFAKAHPLSMKDPVTGEEISGIRKTSLISEFADPSLMRQMVAFWLWRKMGNLTPFDFPVRCNLNGEFYQLAFNSERFTDELIEDVYGLDKFGYGYKNVGTLKSDSGTTAGDIEKKTPDDENESDISVLEEALRAPLKEYGAQTAGEDVAALTRFVVEKFNLPAWLNYLASARITHEMDDVWANVCAYYDNAQMHADGGVRGTDTWMPLGYDFNLSFGQWYYGDIAKGTLDGLVADQDWYKSHPFYGGNRVLCYKNSAMSSVVNSGNDGFEAVLQSAKFRRLYLRRLRTLMDAELKEPGTPEAEVPFMAKMREMADLMRSDAALDQEKWPNDSSDDKIDVWAESGTRPEDIDTAIDEIWSDYVEPRREHLYVTHSATNTAREIGYGSEYIAGIPEAQSPLAVLAPNIAIANLEEVPAEAAAHGVKPLFRDADVCVITNGNAEAVDMSGWTLSGAVAWTLPAGTVCDAFDCLYVVRDRRAFVAAHESELADQVIVGNVPAKKWGSGEIALADAEGSTVCQYDAFTPDEAYSLLSSTIAGREEWWSWTIPGTAVVTNATGALSITTVGAPLVHSLGTVVTNAVVASAVAEIPEGVQGAVMGFKLVNEDGTKTHSVYAYANGNGTFTMYYDDKKTTSKSVPSGVRDLTRAHLWTLACHYSGGLKFYEDGVEIASDTSIKWTNNQTTGQTGNDHLPTDKITFGNDTSGAYPLNGMKIYSAETAAAGGNSVYATAAAALANAPSTENIENASLKADIIENYFKYGVTTNSVTKLNGSALTFEETAPLVNLFGPAALDEDKGVTFKIDAIDPANGTLTVSVAPALANGTLSVLGKALLSDDWTRVSVSYGGGEEGEEVSIPEADSSAMRFFQIRAERGRKSLDDTVE